jgi:hypothetical protein
MDGGRDGYSPERRESLEPIPKGFVVSLGCEDLFLLL